MATPSAFEWSDSTSIAFDEVRSLTVVEDSGALTSLVLASLVVAGALVVATGSALGSGP